jgi:hypothetical protein
MRDVIASNRIVFVSESRNRWLLEIDHVSERKVKYHSLALIFHYVEVVEVAI